MNSLRATLGLLALALALSTSFLIAGHGEAQTLQAISNPWAQRSGRATYYDPTVGMGNCSLPLPGDMLVGAMNTADYGVADYCGAQVRINGPRGSVTVQIVDRCPGCAAGSIDLSPQAFERIAPLVDGNVPISWQLISNASTSGNVIYTYKEGSSQWWSGVQLRNHRNAIARFEVRNAQGQFQTVERVNYNYFIAPSGMGTGPFTFRVTDVYGNVFVDGPIALRDSGDVAGGQQLPFVAGPGATPTTPPTATRPPASATPTPPQGTITPIPGVNVALNRPATASSAENSSLTPNLAVDGNPGTRWSSAWSDPQWLQIDLGAAYTLNRVIVRWEAAYATIYDLHTSYDGVNWTPLFHTSSGNGGVDTLLVNGTGRYLRLATSARATQWGVSLWELEAYGVPATAPTPTLPPPTLTPTATPTRVPTVTNTPPPLSPTPCAWIGAYRPTPPEFAAQLDLAFNSTFTGTHSSQLYGETQCAVFYPMVLDLRAAINVPNLDAATLSATDAQFTAMMNGLKPWPAPNLQPTLDFVAPGGTCQWNYQAKTCRNPLPSPTPTVADWQPYVAYTVGTQVRYNGGTYRCLQGHTSLPGWEPPYVPALWQPVN